MFHNMQKLLFLTLSWRRGKSHIQGSYCSFSIKQERCTKQDFCRELSQNLYYSIFSLITRMKEQRLSLLNFKMAPCWERLQICWKTDFNIQNIFDWSEKVREEKKDGIQKRHEKFYSCLGKISYSNVVDRVRTGYSPTTDSYSVGTGRQDLNSQGKQAQNEPQTATSLSKAPSLHVFKKRANVGQEWQRYPCYQIEEWTGKHPKAPFSPIFCLFSDIIFDKKKSFTACFRLVSLNLYPS